MLLLSITRKTCTASKTYCKPPIPDLRLCKLPNQIYVNLIIVFFSSTLFHLNLSHDYFLLIFYLSQIHLLSNLPILQLSQLLLSSNFPSADIHDSNQRTIPSLPIHLPSHSSLTLPHPSSSLIPLYALV